MSRFTQPSNETFSVGKTLAVSVVLRNGNTLVVDAKRTTEGIELLFHCLKDDKEEEWGIGPYQPQESVEVIGRVSADRLKFLGAMDSEIQKHARNIRKSLENTMKADGLIEDERRRQVEETFAAWKADVKSVFNEMLPPRLGGFDFQSVSTWHNAELNRHEWIVHWGPEDDGLDLTVVMPDDLMFDSSIMIGQKLRTKITKGLNKLKAENPGDFEVECTDSTGIEEFFDEGQTYMADVHTDTDLLWVYDRYGQKGEYGQFRFKVVVQEKKKIEWKEPEPDDKLKFFGEPLSYYKHYNQGDSL